MRQLLRFLLLICLCSCSEMELPYTGEAAHLSSYGTPVREYQPGESKPLVVGELWERWVPGRDLKGQELRSAEVLEGDKLFEQGDRNGALKAYSKAKLSRLSDVEKEALTYRIAALQLSIGKPDQSLQTLSDYFRTNHQEAAHVTPEFSLLFGYAYAKYKDIDQSYAWFSRARIGARGAPWASSVAENEVTRSLQTLSESRLNAADETWQSDEFINKLVSQERARRAAGGAIRSETELATNLVAAPSSPPGELRLGVLAPLTGKYANLGTSLKNGIELAASVPQAGLTVKLAFGDSGETSDQAIAQVKDLVSNQAAEVLMGPLISEQASAVKDISVQAGIPLITFSKRSDFVTARNVFRLGATPESQVDTLVRTAYELLGMRRFAIVSSEDANGEELSEIFKRNVAEQGLELVYTTSYAKGDANAPVAIAAELEKLSIDGVFFPEGPSAVSAIYAALPEGFRSHVRAMGIGNWDNPAQLANSRTVLKGAIFVSLFFADSDRPAVSAFVQSYRDRYRQRPDFLAAQGFDAATLAFQAALRESDQADFPEALRSIDAYDGLTGRIYLGADGEMRRAYSVLELTADKVIELKSTGIDPTLNETQHG